MYGHINTAEDAHHVNSPAEWEAGAIAFGKASSSFAELTYRANELYAGVNAGRWLTRCVICENAPSAHPDWQLAICYECGSRYAPIFPDTATRADIEWLLMERATRNRNWLPTQTVADLQAENEEAGLPWLPPSQNGTTI